MDKRVVLSFLFLGILGWSVKDAAAISDYAINIIDKGTEYVEQVGQVQRDVSSQMSEYMNIKVGIPGDAKMVQKAADKAQRIKNKADKYQAKAEKMKKKMDKAKEKAAAIKAEKDKLQAKADKIKEQYQKAQEKVAKAKAEIAKAKAKADEVKGEIDKAKQQYEDIKGQVEEVKAGINDIKDGAAALKDAAQSKLDDARGQIPGQGDEAEQSGEPVFADAEDIEPVENMNAENAEKAEAEIQAAPVSQADKLSALSSVLQENGVHTAVETAVAVPDAAAMPQTLTPEEVLQKAEEVKLDSPEKTEYSSPLDLEEQLKMLDAAKAKELSESAPQHISDEELRGQLKAGDDAKLEALRTSRSATRKSFERSLNNPKGEADVR